MSINNLKNFKVVLFGVERGKIALDYLKANEIEASYFVDNDPTVINFEHFGVEYSVFSPEKLLDEELNNLRIIITPDFPEYKNIHSKILDMGLGECLYSTSVVCCDKMLKTLFYQEEQIGFCCQADSNFHTPRQYYPYLDTADATIINFLSEREKIINHSNGTVPVGCIGCSLLYSHNLLESYKIDKISISCYPSACQAKCIYCGVYSDKRNSYHNVKKSPYPKMIAEMIQYLKKNNLIAKNCRFGFAPAEITILPHKDLLLNLASKHRANFATNAFRFEPKIADSMKKNNSFIIVSLDAGTKETFKLVKGYDFFQKVMINLKKYREYNSFILKYNILTGVNDSDRDIDGIVQVLKQLNLHSLCLSFEYQVPLRIAFYSIAKFVNKLRENDLSFSVHAYYTPTQIKNFVDVYFDSEYENYLSQKWLHLREVFYNEYINNYNAYKEYIYLTCMKEVLIFFKEETHFILLGLIRKNKPIIKAFRKLGIPLCTPDCQIEKSHDVIKDYKGNMNIFIVPESKFCNSIEDGIMLFDIQKYFYSFEPTKLFLENNIRNVTKILK